MPEPAFRNTDDPTHHPSEVWFGFDDAVGVEHVDGRGEVGPAAPDLDEVWGCPVLPPEPSDDELAAILATKPLDDAEYVASAAARDGVSGEIVDRAEFLLNNVANLEPDPLLAGCLHDLSQDPAGLESLDENELALLVSGWEGVISWARAAQARIAAELMDRTGDVLSRDSTAGHLAASMHVTTSEAWQIAVRAEGTTTYPRLAHALESGQLDAKKADTFLRAGAELTAEERGQAIADLLPQAPKRTWRWISEQMCARAAVLHGKKSRRRDITDRCNVWAEPATPGLGRIVADLPIADTALTFNTVQAAARALQDTPGETRPLGSLRAAALTALITGRIVLPHHPDAAEDDVTACGDGSMTEATHEVPPQLVGPVEDTDLISLPECATNSAPTGAAETGGATHTVDDPGSDHVYLTGPEAAGTRVRTVTVPATVHLTMSAATLLDPADSTPGILDGIGPIPADDAARIAADGTWRRLLTDPTTGILTDYSTRTYAPGPHLRAAVTTRDASCRFPGCDRPATLNGRPTGDLDHIIPFDSDRPHPAGEPGQTRADNLHLLCRKHHNLKTHAQWRATRDPDTGTTRWTTPTRSTHHIDPAIVDPTIRYGLAHGLTRAVPPQPDQPGSSVVDTADPGPPPF